MRIPLNSITTRRGFAITVVLLVTLVSLLAFVFSAALLGLSSRSSAALERQSAQAFLAADSGLSTFAARVQAEGIEDVDAFSAWMGLLAGNDDALGMGNGVRVALSQERPVEVPGGVIVTVRSVGSVGGASRTMLAEFFLREREPGAVQLSVPAALTSFATIDAGNNTAVLGLTDAENDWIFTGKWEAAAAAGLDPVQIPRTLAEATPGEYVQFEDGRRLRVDAEPTCAEDFLRLVDLASGVDGCFASSLRAGMIPFAASETVSVATGMGQLQVTQATFAMFPVNSEIKVGTASGIIKEADPATGTLTVTWDSNGDVDEGDPIRLHVPSGITGGACLVDKADFDPPCKPNETKLLEDLMEKTFGEGTTEDDLRRAAQDEHDATDGVESVFVGASQVGGRALSGWSFVDAQTGDNFRDLTGEGVLVIKNTHGSGVKLNVSNAFQGLIYVIGDITLAGNAVSAGAVIVDGTAEIVEPLYDGTETDITGNADIRYDPFSLLSAIRSVRDPRSQPFEIDSVAGSTRIR